jgi:hypothetical protein
VTAFSASVINVLKKWIEKNFSDFRENPQLLEKFTDFIENVVAKSEHSKWAATLTDLLKEDAPHKLTSPSNSFHNQLPVPKSVLPKDLTKIETFGDVPHVELARQLTLFEARLFSKVTPNQLRSGYWSKENKTELSPDVVDLTNWFNKVTYNLHHNFGDTFPR